MDLKAVRFRVFVGQRAILLPGTHIGDRAIIGAGAVVRGEVPEGMVYADDKESLD
jgi:acetyltransferase-like isoleucine patch superfamily enzyme